MPIPMRNQDEEVLVRRPRREYPVDEVLRKGQGGDVLHHVFYHKERAGTIIYECKRTDRISGSHVRQAMLPKESRTADFAVLVTIGQRKKFAEGGCRGDSPNVSTISAPSSGSVATFSGPPRGRSTNPSSEALREPKATPSGTPQRPSPANRPGTALERRS